MNLYNFHRFVFKNGISNEINHAFNLLDMKKNNYLIDKVDEDAKTQIYTIMILLHFRDLVKMDFNNRADILLCEFNIFDKNTTILNLLANFSSSNKAFLHNIYLSPFNIYATINDIINNVEIDELNNGLYYFSNLDIYGMKLV